MNDISLEAAWSKIEVMAQDGIRLIPNIILGVVVFTIFWFLAGLVRRLISSLVKGRKNGRNLGLVVGRLTQWVVVILGVLIALTIILPGFEPSDFMASLGIGGVAIGFAFRDVLQNFLAGILILLTEPFQLNDQIVFKDFEGTIEQIETRATTIRTYDGRRVVIPNGELFTNAITVNTAYDRRRLEYDFGIGYGDNISEAKGIILSILQSDQGILSEPEPEVIVVELADFTINLRARWWIDPPRQSDLIEARDQVLQAACEQLAESGIDLPFPTQQILFHDQTEETDGDRTHQREGWPVTPGTPTPKARNLVQAVQQINVSSGHSQQT